jgi:tetratricopeptide (TPR) repeat protein
MRARTFLGFGLMVGLACAQVQPVRAQAAAAPANAEQNYDELIRQAVTEFSLGHWTEAKVFFARAHARNPNARTLRGLGLSCYEARSYVEAIGYMEQALASQSQPLTPAMREDLTRLLGQSKQFVSRAVIEVEPPTAGLVLDQKPLQRAADGSVLLDPGEHELTVKAEGYEVAHRSLTAEGGNPVSLRVELRALPGEVATRPELMAPPSATASAEPRPARGVEREESILPWVIVGVGGAVAIAGGVFVGVAAGDKAHVESPKKDATWNDLEGDYKQAKTFFPLGFTLIGVGVAGAAAGLAWKFWPSSERQSAGLKLRVAPGAASLQYRF